ncbi:MAG TPA: Z1 domain-containing protein [Terracidiphilus sp.]
MSDEILDLLGNPVQAVPFARRGLVIGDVQSGKTATYTALISKAADAGYRLIVLLTGTLENLRRQTQERLDEGFVGLDSSGLLNTVRANRAVGVGLLDGRRAAAVFTSRDSDFKVRSMNQLGLRLDSIHEPVLLVAKKNKAILENLANWLRDFNAINGEIGIPLLLIDDEADNASVNTRATGEDPTQINQKIRGLLKLFTRSTYIGFTATPFANIFINPEDESQMLGDDLFPRDFLYALEAPSNYVGATKLFGESATIDALRIIDDAEHDFPATHKSNWQVPGLPHSLIEAVKCFLLACVVRDMREEGRTHRSMLVNISRFTAVQNQIAVLIHTALTSMQQDARSYANLPVLEATKNGTMESLHQLWEREFAHCGFTWEQAQGRLHESIAPVVVKAVNQQTRASSLDYAVHRDLGLRVIAVGGNSLSRGLTLYGLSTSYFYRNSQMYDTLLQMGRWFGYREGYEDLCRVWLTDEAADWYAHISLAADELRGEVKKMMRRRATPKEFGLRVRAHPDSLLVTAQNKMRLGQTIEQEISLTSASLETTRLRKNRQVVRANEDAIRAFLRNLREAGFVGKVSSLPPGRNLVFSKIPKEMVAELLKSFEVHPLSVTFQGEELPQYLASTDEPLLQAWDVAIPNTDNDETPINLEGYEIRPAARFVDDRRDGLLRISGSKSRVGSRGIEKEGLSQGLVDEIAEQYGGSTGNIPDREYRKRRPRPLLLIHAIAPHQQSTKGKLGSPLDLGLGQLFALGLSFPDFDDSGIAKRVLYRVNLVKWKELVEDALGDEMDDDEPEDLDVS